MFSIETSSGKQIRSHSYFQHEDEILLPPGTYLQVISQLKSDDGLHIVHLQEVTPPFELLAAPFAVAPKLGQLFLPDKHLVDLATSRGDSGILMR